LNPGPAWPLGMPAAAWIAAAFVLGLLVGSFLNVVILRLPARLMHAWKRDAREMLELQDEEPAPPGIVRQASHCPHCKHPLAGYDNIPLVSWLLLRGRCRHCKAPISPQYPLVELLTAVLSAVVVWKLGPGWGALAALFFTWVLVAAAGIDLRTQLLPDQLTLPLLWLGLLLGLVPLFVDARAAIEGAAIGYLALWCVYWGFKLLTGKEGMGYGDFKLLGALGAWMGPLALLPIVLLSSFIGAIVGVIALRMRNQDHSTPIPFGPFLAAAGWAWFVFGDSLFSAYLHISGLR
jgi:leader peptidase (prepilin peptidase) / N-methyltransferase